MTNVTPLPFKGDLIDYLNLQGRSIDVLWRDGEAFIPVRPICDVLNVAWQPQHRKLTAPDYDGCVTMMVTQDTIGRAQGMLCIAYPDFMMWLGNLTLSRVKEEAREPLRRLKAETKAVVATFYRSRILGEAQAHSSLSQRVQIELITTRPGRFRVVQASQYGWTFEQLRKSCSTSGPKLVEIIKDCLMLGLIDQPLPGTPFAAPATAKTPSSQIDMFQPAA